MAEDKTFIDLFAGAGGFSLGFEMAGFKLNLAIEKDEWAAETLEKNHPFAQILCRDISTIDDIQAIVPIRPDIIIGGPPCQGFSIAAIKKHDPTDPRNSLFLYFVNWVNELRPHYFVMENVPGILSKKNSSGESIPAIIKKSFENLGYGVNIWKLQAAEFGVPQSRERVFFVGASDGSIVDPPKKTHFIRSKPNDMLQPAITIEEAIMDLPVIYAGEGTEVAQYTFNPISEFQRWARQFSTELHNHVSMRHTARLVNRFRSIQNGTAVGELPEDLKVRARNGNGELSITPFNSNYRHLRLQDVSHTIPASFYSSFIHPTLPRNITTREAARIQSFPDHYQFKGKRTLISKKLLQSLGKDYSDKLSQYNQVGNAVPPLLSKAIASHLMSQLADKEALGRRENILIH